MTPAARVSAAIEILDRILAGEAPEPALTNWGRAHRFAGSGDRHAIRDHVFDALRRRASWAALGGASTGRGLMLGVHLGSAARALAVSRRLLRGGWLTLTGGVSGDVLTLSPPLTLPEARIGPFVEALQAAHAPPREP